MLMSIGRGLSPAAVPCGSKTFFLTTSLPPEITFTRASAAQYINAAGKLAQAAVNAPRFGHDAQGRKLGLLIEPAIVNKVTCFNANPTNTTGFTTSGTGSLSVVNDAAELANAGLDLICTTGNVFKAEATTSGAFTLTVPGTTGNTNKHSASVYARGTGGATAATLAINASPVNIPSGGGYVRRKVDNITPSSSSQKINIVVQGNSTLYFILPQLEEFTVTTTPVITVGATGSRSADRAQVTNILSRKWFNVNKGYLICRYHLPALTTIDGYMAVIHDGTTANSIGLRKDQTNQDLRAYVRAASTITFATANGDKHQAGLTNAAGITWDATSAIAISGGKQITSALSAPTTSVTTLDIGARNGGASPVCGYIQSVEIGHGKLTALQLGAKMQQTNDLAVLGGGQSLIRGYFISQETSGETGKQLFRQLTGTALPEHNVIFVDGSTGGSAACKTSDAVNYWWDNAASVKGPAFTTFYSYADATGIKPGALLWAQGEADSFYIGGATSRADYKNALIAIFNDIRVTYGPIPVFIQRIGRRSAFSNPGGVQAVRDVQQELIDTYDWCFNAAEIYDQPLFDAVHPTDAGYLAGATRNAQVFLKYKNVIASGERGPAMSGATRSGTSVTVTLSHDAGTDIAPASGIDGFKFYDNTTPITVTAAVRTNATTVTLTLQSAPTSGVEKVYYGYDDMAGINMANILKDNANIPLPLRAGYITL
jgi:hypothetical protein